MKNIDLTHNQENAAIGMVMAEDNVISSSAAQHAHTDLMYGDIMQGAELMQQSTSTHPTVEDTTHLPCDARSEAIFCYNVGTVLTHAANTINGKNGPLQTIYTQWADELHKFAERHYPDTAEHLATIRPHIANNPSAMMQVIYLNMLDRMAEDPSMIDIFYGAIDVARLMPDTDICLAPNCKAPMNAEICHEFNHMLLSGYTYHESIVKQSPDNRADEINALKFFIDSLGSPTSDYQYYWTHDIQCWN